MPSPAPNHLSSEGVVEIVANAKAKSRSDMFASKTWRWDQIFGVVPIPAHAPVEVYVLVPKPEKPWVIIRQQDLREHEDLLSVVQLLEQRCTSSGYRDRRVVRDPLPKSILLERVLERQDVEGALTVPIGAGPGLAMRVVELAAGISTAGFAGLTTGVAVGFPLVGTVAGVVGGVALPVALSPRWKSIRSRGKARVLVLTPDGCVVGLPSGPAAFSWTELSSFSEQPVSVGGKNLCLELRDAHENVLGRIDAAWFTKPLPLIVGFANAYRKRFAAEGP